ncbi:hypothetical protein OQX61_02265 [Pedobacter sp. PLR]|uniref:hypothetical protein n=1 Tax=Pedobacter sp. PLR TaxID=2994465 RepID=UPI002247F0F3|nr:hypothetical protein [Pedobacter sp. PLR]MCX2450084.1 hypothetical protein [Pedobacter sp. PLR]
MGKIDFLNKKEQPQSDNSLEKNTEPYIGDLNKTDILFKLVQTPQTERDEKWQQTFLDNIGQASFRCGDPQVITGPDGFPYFQLFLPEPNKSFQCFVIDKMKDDFLLTSGFGVAINPTQQGVDWVLSYGDILNLRLNNTFYTNTETAFSKETNDETIAENEEVMIGQPSETILPKQTRQLIDKFLKSRGVETPKVLLMMRHRKNGNGVSQEIVFNLTPKNFKDESTYRSVMQTVSWYLPRHYSYVGMDEENLGDGFMPL